MKQYTRHQVGDLRPSQLLLTYGVGAIIDLPHLSALVMGLDSWQTAQASEIIEERLLAAVQSVLGKQVKHLYAPPADESANSASSLIGVPVVAFPRWLVCPACRLLAPIDSGLFKLRTQIFRPDRTWYYHHNCNKSKSLPALPSRFMIACEHGHLDDFPWHDFVHRGKPCPQSVLHMQELGVSGEPSAVVIRCMVCGDQHSMAEAFSSEEEHSYRPPCTGRSPHLRGTTRSVCPAGQARTTLLSASNTWFPLAYTLLSLPVASDPLGQLVETYWEFLRAAESAAEVAVYRKLAKVKQAFSDYSDEDIWQKIAGRNSGAASEVKPGELKLPEWLVLTRPASAPRSPDFQISPAGVPPEYDQVIEQVVLVERLREVQALTGFTRIESLSDYTEEEKLPQDHLMPLASKGPFWIPASEVRGEGLFIQFNEQAIQNWLQRSPVREHNTRFYDAHRRWRQARHLDDPEANYPELRYVLLHTFAHALMRQLSLECGYAAASIRERIYAQQASKPGGPMAGILLYTAASDSEGTLGGLVSLGKDLGYHISGALEAMQYCASDPLCAEHLAFEDNTLHGASCHACLFAPETSCERGNKYLDRSVLIGTVERGDLAFFTEIIG